MANVEWPLSEAVDRARSYLALSKNGVMVCSERACQGAKHCIEPTLLRVIEGLVLALNEKKQKED